MPAHEKGPASGSLDGTNPRGYNTVDRLTEPLVVDSSASSDVDSDSQFPCWQTTLTQRDYLSFAAQFYVDELRMPLQPDWGIVNGVGCQCRDRHECPRAGKHPAVGAPREKATLNLGRIRDWIERGRNLAAAPLGYLVVDIELDGLRDGLTPFTQWCGIAGLDAGLMLSTFAVRSGSGGIHLYYWLPSDCIPPKGMDRWLPDVDIKTEAKASDKITLPGSRHSTESLYAFVARNGESNLPLRAPDVLVEEVRAGCAYVELPASTAPRTGPIRLGEYVEQSKAWRHARLLAPGDARPRSTARAAWQGSSPPTLEGTRWANGQALQQDKGWHDQRI